MKTVVNYINEGGVFVYEKLQEICKEILSNEIKTKEFLAMRSIEEIYDFFKSKIPDLSISEFDSFIAGLLEKCNYGQLEVASVDSEMLKSISGGKRNMKLVPKLTLASLAMLTSLYAGSAMAEGPKFSESKREISTNIAATDGVNESYSQRYANWLSETSLVKKIPKIANAIKKNHRITAGVSVLVAVAAAAGVAKAGHKLYKNVTQKNNVPSNFGDSEQKEEPKKEQKKEQEEEQKEERKEKPKEKPKGEPIKSDKTDFRTIESLPSDITTYDQVFTELAGMTEEEFREPSKFSENLRKCLYKDDDGVCWVLNPVKHTRVCAGKMELLTLGEICDKVDKMQKPGGGRVLALNRYEVNGALESCGKLKSEPYISVDSMQCSSCFSDAAFSVASNFSAVETTGAKDNVSDKPIGSYFSDPTQGPRASLSALPGLIFRTYGFYYDEKQDPLNWPQTTDHQLNLLGKLDIETKNGYVTEKDASLASKMGITVKKGDHIHPSNCQREDEQLREMPSSAGGFGGGSLGSDKTKDVVDDTASSRLRYYDPTRGMVIPQLADAKDIPGADDKTVHDQYCILYQSGITPIISGYTASEGKPVTLQTRTADSSQKIDQVFSAGLCLVPRDEHSLYNKHPDDASQRDKSACEDGKHFQDSDAVKDVSERLIALSVEAQLKSAFLHGKKTIVIAPIGCGAFNNDPQWFAKALDGQREFIEKSGMDVIVNLYDKDNSYLHIGDSQFQFDGIYVPERDNPEQWTTTKFEPNRYFGVPIDPSKGARGIYSQTRRN